MTRLFPPAAWGTLFLAWMAFAVPALSQDHAEGWSYFPGLVNPAESGLQVLDPDGSGNQIVVVSAVRDGVDRSNYPFLAVFESRDGELAIDRNLLLPVGARITGRIHRFNRAGHLGDLLAVHVLDVAHPPHRRLLVFGGVPLTLMSEVPLPEYLTISSVLDTDGDGRPEIVGLLNPSWSGQVPALLDIDSGAIVWTNPELIAEGVHVGDVGLAQRVIIVHGANGGLVLDAATRQTVWQWPDGFNGTVVFGDFLPPQGTSDFAVLPHYEGEVKVFRASPTFSPMVGFPKPNVSESLVIDIDRDGYDEILLGNAGGGWMAAYQPRLNGEILIQYNNSGVFVRAMDLLGIENGPDRKLVFGTYDSSPLGKLRVLDLADGQSHHESIPEKGPFHALDVGDVLGVAGRKQVVYANRGRSQWGPIDLVYLDHGSGALLDRGPIGLLQSNTQNARLDVELGQLDADPMREVLVGSSQSWNADMAAFNGGSFEPRWSYSAEGFLTTVGPIMALDVSGDGVDDAVTIVGGALAFVDGVIGEEIWRSVNLNVNGMKSLANGPIAAEGADGIAVGVGTKVYVFDIEKQAVHRIHELDSEVIGQHVEEREGQCFHVLTFSHRLERRDCASGVFDSERLFVAEAVFVGYAVDSFGDIVLGDGRGLMVDRDGEVLVQRHDIDYELGLGNRGEVLPGAGEINVIIGGVTGVHRVRLQTGPLFADGFELP